MLALCIYSTTIFRLAVLEIRVVSVQIDIFMTANHCSRRNVTIMWSNRSVFFVSFFALQEVPDENYDLPYSQTETNGDAVMIKMEMPNREETSFPKEKWKSFWGK